MIYRFIFITAGSFFLLLTHLRLKLGVVYDIDNTVFQGKIFLKLRTSQDEDPYFTGRKRLHQTVVQGRFKKPIGFDSLWGGQKWERKWSNMPPTMLSKGGLKVAKLINPTMQEDFLGEKPFMMFPQIAIPQILNVALPGQEPDIMDYKLKEDTRLILNKMTGQPLFLDNLPKTRRKHFVADISQLKEYCKEFNS